MKSIRFLVLATTLALLSFDSVSACWCPRGVEDTEAKFRGQERPCPVDLPCGGIPRFAEYGNIRASDERAVLDHLAKQLLMSPDEIAYVLIYAGQEACTNEARLRLVRIKNYLVEKHAIASERIVLKDGGFRADLSTQIWLLPSRTSNFPEASPNLPRANKLLGKCKLPPLATSRNRE